jgi:hypothetical protein
LYIFSLVTRVTNFCHASHVAFNKFSILLKLFILYFLLYNIVLLLYLKKKWSGTKKFLWVLTTGQWHTGMQHLSFFGSHASHIFGTPIKTWYLHNLFSFFIFCYRALHWVYINWVTWEPCVIFWSIDLSKVEKPVRLSRESQWNGWHVPCIKWRFDPTA